jgi:BlaI family penicillinase repressor
VQADLTRRERQILEVIYKLGEASANEIVRELPAALANATVRTQLRILEQKGAVKHRREGKRFMFRPAVPHKSAARSALRKVLDVFFAGSVEHALAMHLADPQAKLDANQIQGLRDLIDRHDQQEK